LSNELAHPLIEKFARAGQGHVFAFFDGLEQAGRDRAPRQAAESI